MKIIKSPISLKRKKTIIALSAVLAVTAVCAALALTVFRPQSVKLCRRIKDYIVKRQSSSYSQYEDTDGKIVIRLDPGHGGSDPGAVSDFLCGKTESDINLILVGKLKTELESLGYTVILTWDESSTPSEKGDYPYQERYEASNADTSTDLYISIHCNSFTDPSVSGSRIYFCSDTSGYNYHLAKSISDGIEAVHGDKPRLFPMSYNEAFNIMRHINVPLVLLETLFVSNETDAEKLLSDEWLSNEAKGIAIGIKSFIEGN